MALAQPIEWREQFTIGVAQLDSHHQTLLGLLNEVRGIDRNMHVSSATRDWSLLLLQKFNDYAAYHFLAEEKLIREHLTEDADMLAHIAAHRSYWTSIDFFRQRYQIVGEPVWSELVHYLEQWWLQHMQVTDKELGRRLTEVGVQ